MSRQNTAELVLSATYTRLQSGLRNSSREINSFTTRTKKMLSGIGTGLKRNLSAIPAQLGIIGGTAGLFMLGRNIVQFDDKLNRLGIQGNMTRKQLLGLREEMFHTGLQTGKTRIEIVEGLDAIIQKTGNVKFAIDTYNDLSIASQATGAAMGDLGAMASQLDEKLQIKPAGLMNALDILAGQGKAGSFTLENLATMSERLFSSVGRLDMKGIDDLVRLGAFVQIARSGTGSAEQATTAVERTIANILAKEKEIGKYFNIRDENKKLKEFDVIIKGIIRGTQGREDILGKIFGEEGIRAVSVLAKEFRETGGFGRFDKFLTTDYGGTITKDMERRIDSLSFQWNKMLVLGGKIADSLFTPALSEFNKTLSEITKNPEKLAELDERLKSVGKTIGNLATIVKILFANWKLVLGAFAAFKAGKFLYGMGAFGLRAGLPAAAAAAGGSSIIQAANPLYMMGGAARGNAIISASAAGTMGTAIASTLGPVIAAAIAAAAIGSVVKKETDAWKQVYDDVNDWEKTGIEHDVTRLKAIQDWTATDEARLHAKKEGEFAPAVTLNNQIRLDFKVDTAGNIHGVAVSQKPAPGVKMATHLNDIFIGSEQ